MKKIVAVLFLTLVVVSSSFASFLQIGPVANINFDAAHASESVDTLKNFNKYQFGAEARLNLFFLQLGANGLFSIPNESGIWAMNSLVSANLVAGPNIVNVSIGAAIPYTYIFGSEYKDLNNVKFFESELMLKAGLNFNFSFIGLGLSYYVPTGVPANKIFSNIKDIKIDPARGQLSLAVMFNLF